MDGEADQRKTTTISIETEHIACLSRGTASQVITPSPPPPPWSAVLISTYRTRIPSIGYRIWYTAFSIQHSAYSIQHPASSIEYNRIQHPDNSKEGRKSTTTNSLFFPRWHIFTSRQRSRPADFAALARMYGKSIYVLIVSHTIHRWARPRSGRTLLRACMQLSGLFGLVVDRSLISVVLVWFVCFFEGWMGSW